MTDLNSIFNELVRKILWPSFKALGYKKSGNNFRYYSSEGWGKILQLQRSLYNSASKLSFTVNTGLYLPEVEYYLCGRDSGPKFQEPDCVVRKRIGPISGKQSDSWIEVTPESDTYLLFSQVAADFTQYVHPYLSVINSREDIYTLLTAGYQSHYPSAQIQAMFCAGYQQAALKLFTSEFARSKNNKHYRDTLKSIARELEFLVELWME